MKRLLLLALVLAAACRRGPGPIVVGSKNFTESVLLGEIIAQRLEDAGCNVDRKLNLGGTLVCDQAIKSRAIDVYPEYSGTALTAILHRPALFDRQKVMNEVAVAYTQRGLHWGPPLGFENTFAMIVRRADAEKYGLQRISDLAKVESFFRPGFGYEFVARPDGWHGLVQKYGLHFGQPPRTMDLGLADRAVEAGQIDLTAGNSTDGLIDALGLVVLDDDRRFFPPYDAVIVQRNDIGTKCAAAMAALQSLDHTLDARTMRRLNYAIDGEHQTAADVARLVKH